MLDLLRAEYNAAIEAQQTKLSFRSFVVSKQEQLSDTLDILSKNAEKMTIMITDENADILVCTDGLYSGIIPDTDVADGIKDLKGQLIYTDMGIMNQKYGVYILPMTYMETITPAGSLIVCFSANDVDELTGSTVRTIILASLWVMIASFVAIYFIAEKIVSPLRQMSYATKQFAAGKFDVRISVEGEDEISELATAFNTMAQSLAEIEYTRGNFIASVSHDLRTPMASISGFIDGILDGAIPPEKHTYYLNIIGQEVRRLSRLVSQLLDISRMEAGNRKFEKTPFDICEMARIILLSFESKIDAKRLDVEFNAPDSKLFVYSDKDAINQVIYNICENAVKFSSEGGKYRITISDEGGFVRVSVYNEGVGISPEDLPHIFERFYKSDKSRGLDKTGVGLGLYICSTIMDHLGEKIYVESEHGKYCCFTAEITKYKGKPPISEAD
jgi:signal transduction histidine kinase